MQVAVIEFARNVLKLDADSTEFRKYQHPVIGLITEWLVMMVSFNIDQRNQIKGDHAPRKSSMFLKEKQQNG